MQECKITSPHSLPGLLEVKLPALQGLLAANDLLVLDFETSSVNPHTAIVAGIGFYFPEDRRCFYINVGHDLADAAIPRQAQEDVVEIIRPFFEDRGKHAIAHNATFEIRMLMRMGIEPKCRFTCTMILAHRLDENIRTFSADPTWHYHLAKASYGLKELTQIYFREKPPSLHDVVGGKNTINAPVRAVAEYCALDVLNTWNLFDRAQAILQTPLTGNIPTQNRVATLLAGIDDPNNLVLAKMMWQGIQIDAEEASRQRAAYQQSLQACRELIWERLAIRWPLETPRQILRVLRHLQLSDDLPFDPFLAHPDAEGDEGVSTTREYLVQLLDELHEVAGADTIEQRTTKMQVIAAFLSMTLMKQRVSSFLDALTQAARYSGNRLYAGRFDSTLATTRFSCSPNLQNLPGRADAVDPDDRWRSVLPEVCLEHQRTRDIFVAKPGYMLVSMDLGAAEPRYMALLFQRALRIKSDDYWQQRRENNAARTAAYPELMAEMRRLQSTSPTSPYEIQWPEVTEDPLWRVFKHGAPTNDPYNALLIAMDAGGYRQATTEGNPEAWLKENRWRGKKAFLAFAYGASAETLAPQLDWSIERTREAIRSIEENYVTLKPLRNLTMLQMVHFGQVHTLWGRPRRINGFFQLAQPKPVTVGFYRMRPTYRSYVARIIPLGSTSPAPNDYDVLSGGGGVQAFVEECYVELDDGRTGEIVLAGNRDGAVAHQSRSDPFANAEHFNRPPFRNINFNQIRWVEDEDGLRRAIPRQQRALRAAFNSLCQSTGADHLRWIMNGVDREVCGRPEFEDCRLILTVHDSLVFEVPESKVDSFVAATRPIVTRRPEWSDIDIKSDAEVGRRFGQMRKV